MKVHSIQRLGESFTDWRSWLACAHQTEQNSGIGSKHLTGGNHRSGVNTDFPNWATKCDAGLAGVSSFMATGRSRVQISDMMFEKLGNPGNSDQLCFSTSNMLIFMLMRRIYSLLLTLYFATRKKPRSSEFPRMLSLAKLCRKNSAWHTVNKKWGTPMIAIMIR